jgi:dUTP pyrophosphatase
MNLKIKLNSKAVIPKYAHENDSGMDLFSIEEKVIKAGETALIKTGIQIELPPNTEAQIRPRSGLALKNSITVLNTPGTIDEGYRGEIGVILINHGKTDYEVKEHSKIAQMVICPILRPNIVLDTELSETKRGSNNYGSTGV